MSYERSRPRVGHQVHSPKGRLLGTITSIEGNIVHMDNPGAGFIWRFRDGVNVLHDWPSKNREDECPNANTIRTAWAK